MTIRSNLKSLVSRIQQKLSAVDAGSPEIRAVFTKVGVLVTAQAVLNIRKHRLIDTGRLMNSIRYELFRDQGKFGVMVGSFGVPYAAVHEFGFRGNVSVRAHTRLMTKVFGVAVDPRNIQIGAHSARRNIPARPYLRPAVRQHKARVVELLREAISRGRK